MSEATVTPPKTPTENAPAGWDFDWEPSRRSGAPGKWPPTVEAAYAEFPLRAVAFAIDVVVLTMLSQLFSQAASIVLFWFQRSNQEAAENGVLTAGIAQFLVALAITASAVYFWRVFRATPGQMIFGLFVIRRGTGTMLSRGAATLRWLTLYAPLALVASYSAILQVAQSTDLLRTVDPVLIASTVLIGPMLWYLVLALSTLAEGRRGRGLHDRLAGSVVVRRSGPPA